MPFLHLRYCPAASHPAPDEAALAATLNLLTARLLGERSDLTSVQLEAVPAAHWWIGNQALHSTRIGSYHLTVQLTAGTNDDAQQAAFLAAADRALQAALGLVHPASYIVLQAVPGGDWGYSGVSQAARARSVAEARAATAQAA